jgi:hypothetical protein
VRLTNGKPDEARMFDVIVPHPGEYPGRQDAGHQNSYQRNPPGYFILWRKKVIKQKRGKGQQHRCYGEVNKISLLVW